MIAAPLSAFAQPDPSRPLSQSKEPVSFHYDVRDRLTAIFAHHTNVEYRTEFFYDGRDRRIRMKRKQDGRLTQERLFLWSGDALLEERDALQNNRTVRRFFDQGEQHFAYTAPGLSAPTVTSYYYLRDHLGSIRALIDSNGVARARFDYDWWGARTQTDGTVSHHSCPVFVGEAGWKTRSRGRARPPDSPTQSTLNGFMPDVSSVSLVSAHGRFPIHLSESMGPPAAPFHRGLLIQPNTGSSLEGASVRMLSWRRDPDPSAAVQSRPDLGSLATPLSLNLNPTRRAAPHTSRLGRLRALRPVAPRR